MTGFVTVALRAAGPGVGLPSAGLDVTLRWGRRALALTAAPGTVPAPVSAPGLSVPGVPDVPDLPDVLHVLDEHFAVDADTCADRRSAACADVVAASLPRPEGEARRRLEGLLADHPGAALRAVALAGGGWAVACAGLPPGLTVGRGTGRGGAWQHHRLVPSCLHAYLVAGGSPGRLANADLAVTGRPAPGRPGRPPLSPPPTPPPPTARPREPAPGGRPPGW